MTKKGDAPKDLVTGGASAGTAVVATMAATGSAGAGLLAGALSLIPTVIGLGFDRIRSRGERRAERLLKQMTEADSSPEAFVEGIRARLEADDPELVGALRSLLVASVEAVSDSAIEPMALLGRAYLRGECPTWVARGWLRILAEMTDTELVELRRLVIEAQGLRARSLAEYYRIGSSKARAWTPHIRIRMRENAAGETILFLVPDAMPNTTSIADLARPTPDAEQPVFAVGFAERVYAQLLHHHLCALDERERERVQGRYDREMVRRHLDERPSSSFLNPFKHRDDLVFHEPCFAAITVAFPVRA